MCERERLAFEMREERVRERGALVREGGVGPAGEHTARVVPQQARSTVLLLDRKRLDDWHHRAQRGETPGEIGSRRATIEAQRRDLVVAREQPQHVVRADRGTAVRRIGKGLTQKQELGFGHLSRSRAKVRAIGAWYLEHSAISATSMRKGRSVSPRPCAYTCRFAASLRDSARPVSHFRFVAAFFRPPLDFRFWHLRTFRSRLR